MNRTLRIALAAILALIFAASCLAEGQTGYYDPLPDIYERVSPSVAVLELVTNVWDAKTNTVTKTPQGSGSAVYIAEGGYFLTNYHVIEDADELEIHFGDDKVYEAFVVGGDQAADVAVVKVDEKLDLTPVKIGSSAALRIGQQICTIGTPVDTKAMYNTLTRGIVSGLNREDADYDSQRAIGLIQIDAAINPGNSGGALLNMDGELVGIPFMKYMGYYYKDANGEEFVVYEGLSFAVPIDVAWPIAQSIIKNGAYARPRFGVSVTDNEGPEEPLKNYPPKGLLINEVEKNSPASKAGLRAGDVITHVNGTRVYTFREYTKIVDKLAAGESMTLSIVRYKDKDGEALKRFEKLEVEVTLQMIDN